MSEDLRRCMCHAESGEDALGNWDPTSALPLQVDPERPGVYIANSELPIPPETEFKILRDGTWESDPNRRTGGADALTRVPQF